MWKEEEDNKKKKKRKREKWAAQWNGEGRLRVQKSVAQVD
jgi:hypothetical protein